MNGKPTVNDIVELALESERADPIDWADLAVDEHTAYQLMAGHVIEMDEDITVLKAVITHLLVENFVLNLKLLKIIEGNK